MSSDRSSRCGLKYEVMRTKKSAIGSQMDQTFQIIGPKTWNVLPIFIRNLHENDVSYFKTELDTYLCNLEDIPRLGTTKLRINLLIDILGF